MFSEIRWHLSEIIETGNQPKFVEKYGHMGGKIQYSTSF